jgi:hypothetical protein
MDGLDGDHVVTQTVTSRNNRGVVFCAWSVPKVYNRYGKPLTRLGDLEIWRLEDLRSCKGNVVWQKKKKDLEALVWTNCRLCKSAIM